jgi:hypothetical protein
MVLDRHVLTFDVARFVEAFAERGRITRVSIDGTGVDKSDHLHRRRLGMGPKRARNRTAEQRDELTSPQLIELHPLPLARVTA